MVPPHESLAGSIVNMNFCKNAALEPRRSVMLTQHFQKFSHRLIRDISAVEVV